ncbi:MAG: hypothetical protein EPN57_03470 [Paraburkholderia sp.]|nr:MAG: hypothetical protein EPN57_03470 [Paraburkholderia sp.]
MRGRFSPARCSTGASLLEVLIALSLVASAILGAAAAQLAALRGASSAAHREQAAWIAASVAETMAAGQGLSFRLAHMRERVGAVLPGARVAIVDEAGGLGAVVVHWPREVDLPEQGRAPRQGSCSSLDNSAASRCIALPFASRP